ncbi:hypothetical protein HDU80_005948, partial [Chytriomyces hyalinus]
MSIGSLSMFTKRIFVAILSLEEQYLRWLNCNAIIIHNMFISDNEDDKLAGENEWLRDMVDATVMAGNDGSSVGTVDNST